MMVRCILVLLLSSVIGCSSPDADPDADSGPDSGLDGGPDSSADSSADSGPDGEPDGGDDGGADVGPDGDGDGDGCLDGCLPCPDSTATVRDETMYSDGTVFVVSGADWRHVLPLVPVTTWRGEEPWCQRSSDGASGTCLYPALVYHDEEGTVDGDSLVTFLDQYGASSVVTVGQTPAALSALLSAYPVQPVGASELGSFWTSTSQVVYVDDSYELALLASTYASLVGAPLVIEGTGADRRESYCDKTLVCVGAATPEGQTCHERYTLEELRARYLEASGTDRVVHVNPDDLEGYHVAESFDPELSDDPISQLYGGASVAAPFLAAGKEQLLLSLSDAAFSEVDAFLAAELGALGLLPRYLTIVGSPDAVAFKRGIGEPADRLYAALFDAYVPDAAVGRIFGITVTDVSSYVARSLFYGQLYESLHQGAPKLTFAGNIFSTQDSFAGFFAENGYELTCAAWSLTAPEEAPCAVFAERIADMNLGEATFIMTYSHGNPTVLALGPDGDGVTYLTADDIPVLAVPFVTAGACSTASFHDAMPRSALLPARFLRQGAIGYFGSVNTAVSSEASRMLNEIFITGASMGEAALQYYSTTCFPDIHSELEAGGLGGYTLIGDPTVTLRHQVTTMNGYPADTLGIEFVEEEATLEGDTYTMAGTVTDLRHVNVYHNASSSRFHTHVPIALLPNSYALTAEAVTLVEFGGSSINVPLTQGGDARERVVADRTCVNAPAPMEPMTTTAHDLAVFERCFRWLEGPDLCVWGGTPSVHDGLCMLYDIYAVDRGENNQWWVVLPNGFFYTTEHTGKTFRIEVGFHVE